MMDMRFSRQRELIYKTVCEKISHPTADDVYNLLKPEHPELSLATVYRNLNQLVTNGNLAYVAIPNSPGRYDSTTEKHHHMACVVCHNIFDIDEHIIPNINQIVSDHTEHEIRSNTIMFYGTCSKCKNNKKGE